MVILYPGVLWALFLLVIPIILHLFTLRRHKKVYFSTLWLLKDAADHHKKIRKIKRYLVLASRLLFLFFLIVAFAQPYLPGKNSLDIKKNSISIFADNSFSMQGGSEERTHLDQMIQSIKELTMVFPPSTQYQFITNDFENKDRFFLSGEELRDELTEINYSKHSRTFEAVYNRQKSLLDPDKESLLFWFSDFQKSTLGDMVSTKIDTLGKYFFIPFETEKTKNIYIDSVWLESPFLNFESTNQLWVKINSSGASEEEELILQLTMDDKLISTRSVTLKPNASTVLSVNFTLSENTVKRCKISLEDYPISFDNEYFFVLDARSRIKIVNIYEGNEKFIKSVFSNEPNYQYHSSPLSFLDYSDLQDADLIVIQHIKDMNDGLSNRLVDHFKKGGNVVIFPNEDWDEASYVKFLSQLGIRNVRKVNTQIEDQLSHTLQAPDIKNPFFHGVFEQIPANVYMPYVFPVIQWAGKGSALLDTKNSQVALSKLKAHKGNLFLFSGPLLEKYSNLAEHGLFVPIMYKIAIESQPKASRMAYGFQDKTIALRLGGWSGDQIFKLKKGDLTFIPEQRVLGHELLLTMPPEVMDPGFYEVLSDQGVLTVLAFNFDKRESMIENMKEEELESLLAGHKNVQRYQGQDMDAFLRAFRASNFGIALWKYALLLSLFFLLLEVIFLRLIKN